MIDCSVAWTAPGFIGRGFEQPVSGTKFEQRPLRYGASDRRGSRIIAHGTA